MDHKTGLHYLNLSFFHCFYDKSYEAKASIISYTLESFKSCKELWNKGHRNNGMYTIENAGSIYCHMVNITSCGDGGWTQVIKMDGSKVCI